MSRHFTPQDLQTRTLSELHALRGALQQALAGTAPFSPESRQVLQSLDAVTRMIRLRSPQGPRL